MRTITVDAHGNGDFTTVQEACASIPTDNQTWVTIFVKKGIYKEKITLDRPFVRLIGESREETILTYDDYASKPDGDGQQMGIWGCASTFVLADDFYAENLTFENDANKGQSVALNVSGDRAVFHNVNILGHQDTLYTSGESRQYYTDCYIAGTADFIFGPATAVFDRCVIHSRKIRYVTAASTPEDAPFGYVFLDCKLTGDGEAQSVYLGRPWRPYANVIYVNCWMGEHIKPEGWHNWRNPENELTAKFAEFGSFGPGACPEKRVGWSKQLTGEEAGKLTVPRILGGEDGWEPRRVLGIENH